MRRTSALLLWAAVVAALAGCGVPLSDEAQPITGARRSSVAATPSPSTDIRETAGSATVWYVDKSRLVPRAVAAPQPPTATEVLGLLAVPPVAGSDLVTLLADPVGGPPLAALPSTSPTPTPSSGSPVSTPQQVVLSPTFSELTADEQVLLIGQVVLTLTELDSAPVVFVDAAGAPLSVPLPDGRLRDGAVTRGDYISLA